MMLDYWRQHFEHLSNHQLNPFLYENVDIEQKMVGLMATFGLIKLPSSESDYEIGKNVACTKGAVVFENHMCQLLHYPPQTNVRKNVPIVIIPPWINKYYIFDLSKEKSIIRWLTHEGYEVYCLSWVNADQSYFKVGLNGYVQDGIVRAAKEIHKKHNGIALNFLSYCIGGVGLSLAMPFVQSMAQSFTYLATPFEFDKMTLLNKHLLGMSYDYIERLIAKDGVFHGDRLYRLFSQLKANEMIYQDVIDRVYLKKKKPLIDYLHWNEDVSNIPGKAHLEYVRNVYDKNNLLHILKAHHCKHPVFVLCAEKDHIVPMDASKGIWDAFDHLTFCIGKGGHVAGVVHNPKETKYGHWIFSKDNPHDDSPKMDITDRQNFIQKSWWISWQHWLHHLPHGEDQNSCANWDMIEPAPGRYVQQKTIALDSLFV